MLDVLSIVRGEIAEFTQSFGSTYVFSTNIAGTEVGITQYTFCMAIALVSLLLLIFLGGKTVSLVPKGRLSNLIEYGYEFVTRKITQEIIGKGCKKHNPFIATLFFFILLGNLVGLIPGAKACTGSLSITWALAICSFVYFNFWGVKDRGGIAYLKSFIPSGLPRPMAPFLWVLEFSSAILRALTLAVRLYGNMFAGHILLGIFAILTSTFLSCAIQASNFVLALPSVAWIFFLICMYALEVLVAFLQAYVFAVLSAVYVSLATKHH
ncbi:MAG: F0F1 ATP synthase subunit A [Eggerthellaceae bacterium]|nr:F0F1 ATP synthase subunit A [Eggerthellaceae bacterium]